MITHHEEPVGGDHDVEGHGDRRHLDAALAVEVRRLVEHRSVDLDSAVFSASHMVTRHSDDPLDEVLGAGIGQHADELEGDLDGIG